ncbi:uncharacterized protein LOC122964877 [Acropora millepora]|uniref:uncharacterized protein LOC122964877 n=1 Tax=Acropora millepora TaxID=45264 RepID=UPI001CF4B5C5|nr:uncharacterized protein LOC122964877 [Acropora millepora]
MAGEEEIRSVQDLEKRLSSVSFPFQDVVPQRSMEWFDIFARSHGTTRELLLVSALASTSALIGKSTLEVFPSYEEKGNLFFIAVAQQGPENHPRAITGVLTPLWNTWKLKLERASSWTRRQRTGSKGKRSGVSSARASLIAFTTPRQFFQKAWPKILDAENGLADRILFIYQKPISKDLEEMAQLCEKLNDFPVKSLKVVLEQVYAEHNNDMPVKYSLNASAREAFFKFAKPQELDLTSSQGTPRLTCTNSKRNKHVLCVALNMHIFYDRLKKGLNQETGPTNRCINLTTMNMAISLVDVLETYKGISEICCHLKPGEASAKVGVPNEEVAKRILQMPAKFTTARRVYTSFSSRCRLPVAIVQEAMEELQKNGLGIFKIVEKLKVFYKQSPEMDLQPKLAKYGISLEEFTRTFNQEDDG